MKQHVSRRRWKPRLESQSSRLPPGIHGSCNVDLGGSQTTHSSYPDGPRYLLLDFPPATLNQADKGKEKREILSEDITEADLNGYISAANVRISPLDLEIRNTFHQTSRKRIYAVVNLSSDPMTQLATTHSAEEISFLKRVLDAMFEKYNTTRQEIMAVTSMQALSYCKPSLEGRRQTQNASETQGSLGQGLTLSDAERMLKMLVEEGWFEKSRRGFFSLSPRALMELRQWLVDTYNDIDDAEEDFVPKIKQCFACKNIITSVCSAPSRPNQSILSNQGCRDNDAPISVVHAESTTSASNSCFGHRSRDNVHSARRTGLNMDTWAKRLRRRRDPVRDAR